MPLQRRSLSSMKKHLLRAGLIYVGIRGLYIWTSECLLARLVALLSPPFPPRSNKLSVILLPVCGYTLFAKSSTPRAFISARARKYFPLLFHLYTRELAASFTFLFFFLLLSASGIIHTTTMGLHFPDSRVAVLLCSLYVVAEAAVAAAAAPAFSYFWALTWKSCAARRRAVMEMSYCDSRAHQRDIY